MRTCLTFVLIQSEMSWRHLTSHYFHKVIELNCKWDVLSQCRLHIRYNSNCNRNTLYGAPIISSASSSSTGFTSWVYTLLHDVSGYMWKQKNYKKILMTKNEYFTQTLIFCFMQTNVDKLGLFTDFILNLFESLVWIHMVPQFCQ